MVCPLPKEIEHQQVATNARARGAQLFARLQDLIALNQVIATSGTGCGFS